MKALGVIIMGVSVILDAIFIANGETGLIVASSIVFFVGLLITAVSD